MNVKGTHGLQLAVALVLRILFTDAVVNPGQYSSYPPQSYYSESLSSYGNEHQNYFNNPGKLSASNGYTNEPYKRQQFPPTSYDSSGGEFDDGGVDQHSYSEHQDSYRPSQTSFQDYLSGNFSPFRQGEDFAFDGYADGGATSAALSFDNIVFNNSETMNYQGTTAEDVVYPPLDSRIHQEGKQPHQHHHQHQQSQPRQQYTQSADYMTANNNVSPSGPSRANSIQPMQYLYGDRIPKDNAVSSNAGGQIVEAMGKLPPQLKTAQTSVHHQISAKPYANYENEDEQYAPRIRQHPHPHPHPHQFESQYASNNDRLSNNSSSRTYYVADSDISASTSNQLDSQPLSVFHSHHVQLPAVSSPPVSSSPATFAIPGEPIPISKHVEITKHVPIPVYRQVHVPFRKPVRIEIPRPVITTVPRPYPIQIPTIMKPVAVPMVREVKIPIEKVTPYPVEHKVPYVVEKRVPFQIEKQVAAPIYYPFPVKVPMVRTILHKKKSHFPPLHYYPRLHM